MNEKIGTLVLRDRDQIQNKQPSFILPSDISKLFGVELSPTKDANLMLRKVGGRCSASWWHILFTWGKPEMFKSTIFQSGIDIMLGKQDACLHYCC